MPRKATSSKHLASAAVTRSEQARESRHKRNGDALDDDGLEHRLHFGIELLLERDHARLHEAIVENVRKLWTRKSQMSMLSSGVECETIRSSSSALGAGGSDATHFGVGDEQKPNKHALEETVVAASTTLQAQPTNGERCQHLEAQLSKETALSPFSTPPEFQNAAQRRGLDALFRARQDFERLVRTREKTHVSADTSRQKQGQFL